MKDTSSNTETKKLAAKAAAAFVQHDMVVGVGTGSTMVFVIHELARRVREEGLRLIGVPTSFQSRILCLQLGIPERDMDETGTLDLAIDGADEVAPNLDLIKGGGAAMTREKVVASMAKQFVVVADESKLVERLGSKFPIPVEVLPAARGFVERAVRDLGGQATLRTGVAKDGPVVTDNGQFIFDLRFPPSADLRAIDDALHRTPGVIETGLFLDMADKVLIGSTQGEQGTVRILEG